MSIPKICPRCGDLAFAGGTVTIPSEEFVELSQLRQYRDAASLKLSQTRLKSHSKIARDPEVAQFVVQCAETMILREIVAECIEKFGPKRAPSRSAIHRFIHAISDR